jgi:hypothetical protein
MKSILQEAAEKLEAAGYAASYEYPGYIEVHEDGIVYQFGTANAVFGCDAEAGAGGRCSLTCDSLPCPVTDADAVFRACVDLLEDEPTLWQRPVLGNWEAL